MKLHFLVGIVGLAVGIVFFGGCKDGDGPIDPPAPSDTLKLVYPTGGETLAVGQEVKIDWNADPDIISSVMVELSTDGGIDWVELCNPAVIPTEATHYNWTPTAAQAAEQCYLRIYDYTVGISGHLDVSGAFTVSAQ